MLTLSKGTGINGTFKKSPGTFVVKEITKNGIELQPDRRYSPEELRLSKSNDGRFATFVLQKENWNAIQALEALSKMVGRGRKAIGYAGIKDRRALTVQLASIFGADPEKIENARIKDIKINGVWRSDIGIDSGELLGNAFEVIIATEEDNAVEKANSIYAELAGLMPNYFDMQRFGIRLNNAKIGLYIMKGDFRNAAMEFLTSYKNETNGFAVEARKRLLEEQDFKRAIEYFPKYLKYERRVISYLSRYPNNFANAIRKLPRGVAIMFINAVEDLIFNAVIEERIRNGELIKRTDLVCGEDFYGFPDVEHIKPLAEISKIGNGRIFPVSNLIGYETKDNEISDFEKNMMEMLCITKDSFKIPGMPELSMRGARRPLFAPIKNFHAEKHDSGIRLTFSIPAGSYATVLINELLKKYKIGIEELLL